MKRITEFQNKVYKVVSRIPRGKVSTYAAVARAVGCGSPRAVGQALRCNPFAPKVPCHRVISSSLGIGGFQGEVSGSTVRKKITLLGQEGVAFDHSGRLKDAGRLFSF